MSRLLATVRTLLTALVALALAALWLAPTPALAAGQVKATATVNVRSAPSTSASIVGSLRTGQVVTSTGTTKDWTKITYAKRTAYVASRYLSAVSTPAPSPAPSSGAMTSGSVKSTSGDVNLRKGPGTSYGVVVVLRSGTRVTALGSVNGGFAEVYAGTRRGWISTQYLRAASGLPGVIGTRVTTAVLAVRTSPDASAGSVGDIAKGTTVSITGAAKNGRSQIVYRGAARWVTSSYLATKATSTPPASGVEQGLQPNAVKVYRAALKAFPQIKTYYGVRSADGGDHSTGRALDLMLPDYKSSSSRALGKQIAEWARRNAKTMGVHYVIWDQKIWNIQRDAEGWRPMADRGSDSANHKNHVHVSVF